MNQQRSRLPRLGHPGILEKFQFCLFFSLRHREFLRLPASVLAIVLALGAEDLWGRNGIAALMISSGSPGAPAAPLASLLSVEPVQTPERLQLAFRIRAEVFVEEQHVPADLERDEDDGLALHLLAWRSGEAVGTARAVRKGPGRAKIGRVAVVASARGLGVGKLLMDAMHRQLLHDELFLDAQVQVIPFYESLGYRCEGPEFEECGILHRRMIRCQS
jgi:predicted GNAT family N-acyltransferase